MATIGEINQTSSYTGNAAIGGHIDAPVVIDPSPIQRFATFNFYSDQAKWEKKQKDDAEAARQIASVSAYDITSPLTQYSDALKSGLKDLQDYMMANPKALNYSSDPKGYQEMQKKINSFANLRKSATASDAVYNANKNAIDTESVLKNKAYLQADLDTRVKELFAGGIESAQNKVLASSSPIRPDGYKVPTAKITTYEAISSAPNADYLSKFKFINLDQLASEAAIQVAGWNTPSLDETSPSFKALSPERQDLERQRDALAGKERKEIGEIATSFNSLLPEWQQAHSREDISQIQGQPTGKDTVLDIVKSANGFNSQIKQLNAMITAGKYKDPTGKVITHQFEEINVGDGLSQEELIMMHSLQESKVPIFESLEKTIHSNDNAIQLSAQAEQKRNNIAEDSTRRYIANLNDEAKKAKATDSAGNPLDFGNLIYAINSPAKTHVDITKTDGTVIKNTTIKNGVIVDQKGDPVDYSGDVTVSASAFDNSIITEFNKYAGATKVNATGDPNQSVPTAQLQTENGHFLLRMENGTVKGIKTSDGTFATADQFQHITLEAGQKGATKYKKPDTNYGKFDKPNPDLKTSYEFNGKKFSIEKITNAAAQENISVEEYIKKFGLK